MVGDYPVRLPRDVKTKLTDRRALPRVLLERLEDKTMHRENRVWGGLLGELFWNCSLTAYEMTQFGGQKWWWKLHWMLYRRYRSFDPDQAVRRLRGENPGSLAYGETPACATRKMVELMNLAPGGTLVDLGCGRGLVALVAACLGLQTVGIEIMDEYLVHAEEMASALKVEARFLRGDFLTLPLPRAQAYFAASTAFQNDLRQALADRLLDCAPTLLVTQDWLVEQPGYQLRASMRLPVTWGTSLFTLHEVTGMD